MPLSTAVCPFQSLYCLQDYSTYSQKQNPLYDAKTVSVRGQGEPPAFHALSGLFWHVAASPATPVHPR